MKSGIKTTEFYVTVVTALISIAVSGGFLSPEEGQEITNSAAQVIEAVSNLVVALTPVGVAVSYIWSRTKVKGGLTGS